MKRKTIALMTALMFIVSLSACGDKTVVSSDLPDITGVGETKDIEEDTGKTGEEAALEALETEGEPVWAQGIQMDGELFQQLNLDGVGGSDDEVYISIYQFGGFEDKCIVLRVHLGTGETMARILPVYGYYTLQTGILFSEDKQALVLEVGVPGSNYGASDLFVFDVFPVGPDPVPTIVDRLDTTSGSLVSESGNVLIESGYVICGTEIMDIEGTPLQGLTVNSPGQDKWHEEQTAIFWTGNNYGPDDGWALLEE